MSVIASSFASYGVKVQYLMAIVVVLSAFALQVNLRPFSNDNLNFMENLGLGCLFLSMYMGILFFWDSFSAIILGVIGDFVIAINIPVVANDIPVVGYLSL